MRLLRIPAPFDSDQFLFEPKIDGFRALAHVGSGRCTLVSRNGNTFSSWPTLANEIADSIQCRSAILDGEVCCVDADGRPNFSALLFRREQPVFYAFDVIVMDGTDLRDRALLERKRRLKRIMPRGASRLLRIEHAAARGIDLYRAVCENDLEGIVAKWVKGTYRCDGSTTSWLKIKNARYSQMQGRAELFERSRVQITRTTKERPPELVLL